MSIGLKTHKLVWGKSGNRCAICKVILVEDSSLTDDTALIGEECHIIAKEKKGPRGDNDMDEESRDLESNLLLLCCNHHKIIDTQVDTYTIEYLRSIKVEHEEWVNSTLDNIIDKEVLKMCDFIEKWEKTISIIEWTDRFRGITYSSNYTIEVEYYNSLKTIEEVLFKRFRIAKFRKLENEFDNFRNILHDFIEVFAKYIDIDRSNEEMLFTERFYKINEWNQIGRAHV